MQKTIRLGDRLIPYEWEIKRVKNINLRLRADGSIAVSSGPRVPQGTVEAFLLRELPRLLRARERYEETRPADAVILKEGARLPYLGGMLTLRLYEGSPRSVRLLGQELHLTLPDPSDADACRKLFDGWWREKCAARCAVLLDRWFPRFARWGIPFPTLRFRTMSSRWGSCQPATARISLNLRLLHAPEPCIEYIIVHELAHLVEANHSPAFHAVVTEVMPDWKARRQLLKRSVIPFS